MKTLIFKGSPRKNGDTVSLINKVIENLYGEYKIVNAYDCGISPCVELQVLLEKYRLLRKFIKYLKENRR